MTAEQWLADLEAKSTKAAQARKLENVCGWWDIAEFCEATTPATVLRLVAMVRWLAARDKKLIQRAYTFTGIHHDQA